MSDISVRISVPLILQRFTDIVSRLSDTPIILLTVSARSIGRLRLQVLPRILHGLEIGRDLHQRDADTA